ncbi:hypothetical protein PG997_009324 [Apiospora hydei]|uniref:Uncharacterized protein n=1 Tax=Apiospora hydei TaxID=1337664 RepID=A0ABR1VWH7_9PEZI
MPLASRLAAAAAEVNGFVSCNFHELPQASDSRNMGKDSNELEVSRHETAGYYWSEKAMENTARKILLCDLPASL